MKSISDESQEHHQYVMKPSYARRKFADAKRRTTQAVGSTISNRTMIASAPTKHAIRALKGQFSSS